MSIPQVTPFPRPDATRRLRCVREIPDFIVAGRFMRGVIDIVLRLRQSRVTVLITGETGTGKEKVAQAIHFESVRCDKPFVPLNLQAISPSLVDSQLFGHKKGSFTGAASDFPGVLRATDGGTLLLDEIGDLDPGIQVKLLRFLQDGDILPIGATRPVRADVRIIAATNRDLEKEVRRHQFRDDLFYRLATFHIKLPPLRERRDEIPDLIEYYRDKFCRQEGRPAIEFHPEAMEALLSYDYPGNIRELCNEIWRQVLLAPESGEIPPGYLPEKFRQNAAGEKGSPRVSYRIREGLRYRRAVEELERQMIPRALDRNGHNLTRAAEDLGLSVKGLRDKLKRLGLYRDPAERADSGRAAAEIDY